MSVATLFAPKAHKAKGASAKEDFKALHLPGVQRDFSDALGRGVTRLVVTPKCVALSRRRDSSRVRVDLTADCRELTWLKKLYKNECPEGMIVRFSAEVEQECLKEDTSEHFMLVVHFMATT